MADTEAAAGVDSEAEEAVGAENVATNVTVKATLQESAAKNRIVATSAIRWDISQRIA